MLPLNSKKLFHQNSVFIPLFIIVHATIFKKYKCIGICLGTDHLTLRGGGYGFLFRSEIFFRTTQELEYLFFSSRKAQIFFQKLTLG
jgi:hypothetical protein